MGLPEKCDSVEVSERVGKIQSGVMATIKVSDEYDKRVGET